MNFYSKIIILTTSILCFSSCMGTDEAELAGKFLPPQVAVGDATISNESTTVVLNASYKQSSSSTVIDEVGFYYGDNSELTSAEKLVAGTSNETFLVKVLPNTYGKEYFYKAYLSNGKSEILSSVKSFTMPGFENFVTLDSPKVITASGNDVSISATISKAEGVTLSEAGIFYSSDSDVSIEDTKVTSNNTETINVEIQGLTTGAKYYMRSYVMDREYIAFSETVEFVPHAVPSLTTVNVSEVSYTTAISGGSSISDNGLDVTSKGVVWSTETNPTIELPTKTENGAGKEEYVANVTGLSPGTKYYLRAYAINSDGVGYGNEITFETLSQSNAAVTTTDPSEVTSSSAVSGGIVTSDGGAEVTCRGVVWSKDHNPTISFDTKTSDGSGIGKFTSTITGLEPGTTYYVRAYATNALGTSYGEEVSFTTQAVKPTVSTTEADEITQTSAKVGGNVTATGGAEVTERGIVWSTSKNPTTSGNKKQVGNGTGSFTAELTDLSIATTYYVRAYAINSVGTSYGEEISFTTGSAKPAVTTISPSEVTSSSAVSGGNVTSDGGSAVTARGVVWSKEHNPTVSLSTKTTDGTGTGNYVSSISGLEPGVTYYIRAYATNANGTTYGEEVSFTTNPVVPTVSTNEVSDDIISDWNIPLLGGNVTETGGAEVIERGLVWSSLPNPTVEENKIPSGSGLGQFEVRLYELSFGTRYYIRAYAINSAGISYGNEVTFYVTSLNFEYEVVGITENNYPRVRCSTLRWSDEEFTDDDYFYFGYLDPELGGKVDNRCIINSGTLRYLAVNLVEYIVVEKEIPLNTKYIPQFFFEHEDRNITVFGEPTSPIYVHEIPEVQLSQVQIATLLSNQATLKSEVSYITDLEYGFRYNTITSCGMVWSTEPNPTIALPTKTDEGGILGTFTSTITGLTANTTYYARPYAINQNGVVYGEQITFTTKNNEGSTEGVGNEDFEW